MSSLNSIFWEPSKEQIEASRIFHFQKRIEANTGLDFLDYKAFHKWSVENFESFWRELLLEVDLICKGDFEKVYKPSPQKTFWGGKWFPDLKLNFAENILAQLPEEVVTHVYEDGTEKSFSKLEFLQQVSALQAYFLEQGLKKGDRVVALIPNIPEALTCMIAVTSLGGIWSSCSPDFGVKGVLDRFVPLKPKFLITTSETTYNGKTFDLSEKNAQVKEALKESLRADLFVNREDRGKTFKRFLEAYKSHKLIFERFDFNHPLYILFSSGTTGAPKCIVHSAGGSLLQHLKEHQYHCDLKAGEKLFYYSTTGWMMWNWLLTALASGVSLITYEGAPMPREGLNLWEIAEKYRVDFFGTSARFIAASRSEKLKAFDHHKPRIVCSTGSPLLGEDFDYFYKEIDPEKEIQLASISGGTDIVSCFMLGNPMLPVRRGEIQGAGLGMDVRALNDSGEATWDEAGELVCGTVFPSMPLYFYEDENNARYKAAYFEDYPELWCHGDYVSISSQTGGIVVSGRSDATLNPGGVRIGTAEIYRPVEKHPEVEDSLVVGKDFEGDERILLFVKTKEAVLSEELVVSLKKSIREEASPRHVPYAILPIEDIPYTLSGKKVEIAVKKLLKGIAPKNLEALSNPESLKLFEKYRDFS